MNVKRSLLTSIFYFGIFTNVAFAQQGYGPGSAGARGRMQFDADNATGWVLMTPAERNIYHDKMVTAKTYEDCLLVQRDHHAEMVKRADSKGLKLDSPRQNACVRMKERGFYN